jgi:hypothetical protein
MMDWLNSETATTAAILANAASVLLNLAVATDFKRKM